MTYWKVFVPRVSFLFATYIYTLTKSLLVLIPVKCFVLKHFFSWILEVPLQFNLDENDTDGDIREFQTAIEKNRSFVIGFI